VRIGPDASRPALFFWSNVNDDFTGRARDLGALEAGKPAPHFGPRP